MKLTNRLNLPQPVVDAIANNTYDKGDADISVSQLWQPAQIRELMAAHADVIEQDAADMIWILFGECMHMLLEKAGETNIERITEKRIYVKHNGKVISGKPDTLCLVNNVLQDWKSTKTWSLIKGSREEDWLYQLNTYAWMLRRQPMPRHVAGIQAVAFLLDWSTLEQKRNPNYPPKAAMVVDIPLIPDEEMTRLIEARLALLDRPADPCTPDEMWEKPPIFAIMKPGGTRAIKLADTEEEAAAWISYRGKPRENLYVEARPTKRVRCESYCPVRDVCPQWEAFQEGKADISPEKGGML